MTSSRHRTHARAWAAALVLLATAGSARTETQIGECTAGPVGGMDDPSEVWFRIDGEAFREGDLPVALQQALFDVRSRYYQSRAQIADAAVLDLLLAHRAKASGKSRDEIARELLSAPPPDDARVEAFYEENKARIPYPLDQVRDRIRQMLGEREVEKKRNAMVARFKDEHGFELALAKPVAPVAEIATDGFPAKGAADPKVTIVEFADYQCPHCRHAVGALDALMRDYENKVRLVYVDFPINPSGISRVIAQGAACADRQGAFWRYHDLAFERQDHLTRDSGTKLAQTLGLDMDAFHACLASDFPGKRVAKAEAEARRLGLSGTPTFFLNGRRMQLRDFEKDLRKNIDEALGAGAAG